MQIFVELVKRKIDISPAYTEFENLEKAITQIQSQIEFTTVYKDLGTNAPQWQNVYWLVSQISRQFSISFKNQADNIDIYADPLLVKVFENLIENSIRHGQTASVISLSSIMGSEEMKLIFEDDGIGISNNEKMLIFERGYGKNTGLGLFFIREILSITGITIKETGEEGRGVRFELSIPHGMWRFSKTS